ncbi:copper chaperone PCu(A)C [Thalassovita mangrovi]|uniref:Copper chaperone PCu(A)C n=1 Tax=Thalassovita mangrovi TaxID=2692236 RepID=A0A6L8LL92_9RHOB|nr:copper chaperone PCu(A)C [Thalassovita mangrovi]MYM56645.1 copper chaperone PCu(A)C [Thalassovita mangrovi]
MSFKTTVFAAVAAAAFALPAFAEGIMVEDPYARASSMMSNSGAAFMMIHNHTGQDDHLVSASSDVAQRVELHTHMEDANGVMKMVHVEEGFDLPKDGMIAMQRGGKHVMFLGLNHALVQGEMVNVTLTFEKAGDVTVEVPVDLERKPAHGMMNMDHSKMKMGQPSN